MFFDKVKFANIIKNIKETYSNQEEFSKQSGIGRTYLSQYMNMKKNNPPKLRILKKLADASNGVATYKQLMLICNYIAEDLDSICGESISLIPNPYTENLDYNPSEQFLFSIIHSYNNLDDYNQEPDEKNKIANAYDYIKNDDTYKKLITEYEKLKKQNLKATQNEQIDDVLNEAMIGMSKKDYDQLTETQKKQIRDFAIFVKNQNEVDKK